MGAIADRIRQIGKQDAIPSDVGAGVGQIDEREQAIIDKHKSAAPKGSIFQKIAQGRATIEIDTRKKQRAYAEKPPSTLAAITVDPAREMVANLGDRAKVLDTMRKLSPEQRQEALKLAPGIAQQLGDDRGGVVGRTLGALSRGVSHGVSQPIAELVGLGGTAEEIEYIRQLDAAASAEFSPARPGDPWYERGPLQAVEMAPWMATVVGGAGIGRAAATGVAGRVAGSAAAGSKAAGAVQAAGQALGKLPQAAAAKVGIKGVPALTAGKAGELAGITVAAFPGQYAQEIDQLKALGMQDGTSLRLLAGATAAITGLVEGIVPNPFGAGKVPLTEGAVKAARQYLWEAAKKAPAEMGEEYLQGVTSGLGKHVAQYLDENAEEKTIADAFQTGWDQAKEAALPMAFLLGVPALGGASLSALRAQRLAKLQETRAKGFVSAEEAKELGIAGKNRNERRANADAEIEQLSAISPELPPEVTQATPPGTPPQLPGAPGTTVVPPQLPPPLPQGAPNASQVPTNEGSPNAQGNGGEGSQVPVGSQVRGAGQDQGSTQPASQEPAAPQVQVKPKSDDELMADWRTANPPPEYKGNRPGEIGWTAVEKWRKAYDEELATRRAAEITAQATVAAAPPEPPTPQQTVIAPPSKPVESSDENPPKVPREPLAEKASEDTAKPPELLTQPPESKWQSETRSKLEAVPALKGAKIEADEKASTVKVTRPDGLSTTIHFNADEELAKAAKEKLRNPKSVYGRYVREPGVKTGAIYLRSDANHTNILNHEVMHWLEDEGVVTKEEVEQYGGREAIAEKYGKWAELKQRKKDSVFQRIYDALEPVFSSQRRFFEEIGKRQAPGTEREPNVNQTGTEREQGGWKPAPKAGVSIIESPDSKLDTSRREKKDPQFPITKGSPVTVYRRGKDGREEMQEGVVEDFADHMPGNIKVRLSDGSLVTPFLVDVGPQRKPTEAPKKPQPSWTDDSQKNYVKQKRALTKAEGTKDPREILKAAEQGIESFKQFGEPDDWSRWERAKEDAEQAIKRGTGNKQGIIGEQVGNEPAEQAPDADLEALIEAEFDTQLGTKKPAEKPKAKDDTSKYGDTPIGRQFAEAKAAGGDDTILFFRMGDFYELYFEDAQKAAKILGLTLVTRDKSAENPIPMAGFPYHQIDGYLQKLKSAGFRVAVNEAPFPPKRTGEKKPSKPKTRIRKAADTARQEADDLWAELNKESKDKLTTGLNPDLAKLAVRVALAEIKAGTLSFAAFVEQTVAKVPADMLDKLKPYMEMAWKVAHKRGMTDDPAGKFDDYKALYTVEGEEGMIARVFKHEKGFSVNVTDTDSGLSGDQVRIFPTLDKAKEYADTIKSDATSPELAAQAAKVWGKAKAARYEYTPASVLREAVQAMEEAFIELPPGVAQSVIDLEGRLTVDPDNVAMAADVMEYILNPDIGDGMSMEDTLENDGDYQLVVKAGSSPAFEDSAVLITKKAGEFVTLGEMEISFRDFDNIRQDDVAAAAMYDQVRQFLNEMRDEETAHQKANEKTKATPRTDSPQTRIANRVHDALENGEELNSQKFFAIADEEFGGTRANNDYGDSQATDALELGVNLYLQGKTSAKASTEYAKQLIERIQKVMQLVPRHRGRTGNKDLMQQFSTPPAYAYAVNWIANVAGGDVVLEPSAGMGGIAIHAANSGATVYANELDPTRAEGLRELPLEKVFTEDAEQIGAILKGKMPGLNVIIMNPPFSRAGMRMGDRMVQGTDRKHIDEALTLLPDGGRLVAIVGAGLHGQGQKMTQWLDNLPYQLVANIEVAREVYRGYGTEFPTRVLVIDKVPRTGGALVAKAGDLSELIDLTEEVRNDRPARRDESIADQPDSQQGTQKDGGGARTPDATRDTADTRVPDDTSAETGTTGDGQRQPDRGDSVVNDDASSGGAGTNAGGRRGGRGGGGKAGKSGGAGRGSKSKSGGNAASGKSKVGNRGSTDRGGGLTKVKAKSQPRELSVKTELGESTFEVYTPSVVVEGAKPHPAPIVESAAMSAVDAPRIDYEVDLMPGVLEGYVNDDGVYVGISDIQLEAVAMAGAAHEQKLPSGERRGFLIGDGTGVGKAREALGIIMDDFIKRGTGERRKAVFITKNDGLVKDAVGEWTGVGGDPAEMQPLSNVASGAPVNYESGVLTLSYDTLKGEASVVAKSQGNALSRVEQIIAWVGEDFDGVVVFDEAHLMANSLDTGTGNQTRGASMRALAGVDLQTRLPNARFVYLSATAATEVRNLAYAERLGLWGAGTAFDSKHRFISEIEAGGVAAMEKVAADMKAMGMYVARNLSFDDGTPNGRVEFDRIMHTLSGDQRRVYDKLSEAWLKVLADIDRALDITDNAKGKSRVLSAFWSSNQRFWNDVVTTMMAPTLINNIEKDLAEGRSVVIQLSTTKEAATGRAIAGMKEGQTYDEIDASPRRSLMEYVERAFPTQRHETYIDDAGNERSRPVFDSEGNAVHDPQAVAMKERLLDEIGSLDVAARGPIDMIIDHFGTDMVAEISGRSQRLTKGEDGRLELEKRGKAAARADRDSFMDGKKRVLLFSEAGGTGASYHASLSVANQQRRSHYLWQPGWSAPVAVQGLGRAHRSNQASAPILHLLEPNLEGYKRFISTIARRLGQLGALTKGQRTAADAGLFGANDNLESTEANSALFQFMRDAVNDNIDGIDREFLVRRLGLEQLAGAADPTPEMFTITQFLNRMLNLPLGEQNRVFSEFQSRLDNIVAQAIQDGTLDQGMETLKAERIVKANETLVHEHSTGAKTKLVELTLTHKVKPRSYVDMLREADAYTEYRLKGFARSKTNGNVLAIIDQKRTSQDTKGRTLHDAMAIGVISNTYGHSLEQFDNEQYWEKLSDDQAKALWDEQFAKAPSTRESTTHLLTGALLPVWNRIPGERSRVVRALTTDGEMILGRVVPERMLQRTLDSLGVSVDASQKQYTPQEAIQAIYQGGTVELVNGWKIKKRTIDGEDNIEIMGPDYASKDAITNAGGFSRRIDYATRFFIPFNDANGEVLGEIARISPIKSITGSSRSGGGIAMMKAIPTRQSRSTRQGDSAAAGIAAADIQKTAERLFDVSIRQGGFSQRAAGIYKWLTNRNSPPSPEVVRTAEDHYANLAVIAHEIAHHIDETTKAVKSMPKEVKSEIARLDYEPQKGRSFEGWAEFLRRYMTEPPIDVASNMIPNPGLDAPKTLAWFENTFLQANPEVAKAIAEFRKYAQQFAQQSVFQRVGTLISDRQPEDLSFKDRWLNKARRRLHRLKTNFVDKFHTLEWIQKEAADRGHEGIGIYDLTMAHYMSASSHATIAFEEGVRSLQTGAPIGNTTLWGLRDNLESDGEYSEAVLFSLARHTLFMDTHKPGYKTGMDVQDAEALIAKVRSDGKQQRYEKFAKELAQFNNDLIEMLVQAGALPRQDADKMLRSYDGQNYFPLHRVQDAERSMFAGSGVGFVNLGKAVPGRSRRGSGRQIVDPIDATVTRAIRFYGRAIQARQQQVLAETLDPLMGGVGGMGGLMDRVDPRRKVTQGTIDEILKTLTDEGVVEVDDAKAMRIAAKILNPENGTPGKESIKWFAERHGIEEIDGEYDLYDLEQAAEQEPDALAVISLWRPDYTPSSQKRTVVIYDKQGKPIMYEMDPELYATATGMDELQFGPFMSLLRESSRWFKTGAVSASTGFGTANLFRDYWEFQGKARHTSGLNSLGKPPAMLGRYIAEKARKVAGQKANDPLIRLYEESGGKVYSVIGHDVRSRKHYRRRRIGKSTMSKLGLSVARPGDTAESVLDFIQDLIAISDAPPRLADAEAAIKEDGFAIRNGQWFDLKTNTAVDRLPEATRIKAATAMAEATINFKRIGSKGQYIEAFFPFFNATVQAAYRQYGQFKNLKRLGKKDIDGMRAKRFLVYLSALASTGVLYWLFRHDDDDWREQDAYLRDGYWTWGANGKTYVRIPKPRDSAVVSNVVENMLDAWYHEDARDIGDVVLRDFGGRVPTGGGFLRGVGETYVADYDYFRERDLTPSYLKDLPKEQQFEATTTRASKAIGQVTGRYLNTSPIQLEHLLNSASGGFYRRMTDLYDASVDGRVGPEHWPFLRGLFLDRHQARSVGTFYDDKGALEEAIKRDAVDKGKASDESIGKLAVMDGHSELMTAIRELESRLGTRRNYEYQPYIVGLARQSLGWDELENNPNPFTDKSTPEEIAALVSDFKGRAIIQATEVLKEPKEYKNAEDYEDQRKSIVRGKAKLDSLELSIEDAKQSLLEHWQKAHGSTHEIKDGRRVLKETLRSRLNRLTALFNSK